MSEHSNLWQNKCQGIRVYITIFARMFLFHWGSHEVKQCASMVKTRDPKLAAGCVGTWPAQSPLSLLQKKSKNCKTWVLFTCVPCLVWCVSLAQKQRQWTHAIPSPWHALSAMSAMSAPLRPRAIAILSRTRWWETTDLGHWLSFAICTTSHPVDGVKCANHSYHP